MHMNIAKGDMNDANELNGHPEFGFPSDLANALHCIQLLAGRSMDNKFVYLLL